MPGTQKLRYLFVDLLRGWAVILMIEAHVVNGLLRSDLKETITFEIIHFINGAVAPAFLFMAGFTFAISSQRKWEEYIQLRQSFLRQIGRLSFILFLGYSLHLPFFSLRKIILEAKPEELASLFQVDILHTIAVSLVILLFALLVLRRELWLRYFAFFIAALVVFPTPIVWSYDFSNIFPLQIASYFNAKQRSVFPLFPWSAFVFCGTLTSQLFLSALQKNQERKMMAKVFWGGGIIVILGIVSDLLPVQVYETYDFWHTSPSFFMIRLGIVLMGSSGMWWYERRIKPQSSVLQVIGQESLFVYAFHLVIVYGSVIRHPWLVEIFGPSLNFLECFGVLIGLVTFTSLIAYLWHALKTKYRLSSRFVQYAVVGTFLFLFLTREY